MDNEQKAPEPTECTVSVMTDIPAADVTRFLKASKVALIVRGIIFLIFGIMMMASPVAGMTSIVIILGVYVLFEGFATLRSASAMPSNMKPLWLTNAIILILLGIFALVSPLFMGQWMIMIFGIWQLLSGLQCLLLPTKRGRQGAVLSGVLSIIAGLFFIGMPIFGMMAMGWLFASLFFLSGVLMLTAGAMLR